MSFWEKIQKDIKRNIKEGVSIVKEGSAVVSHKIEELTEEGKRQYKIFSLNMKVQDEFAKLGGRVYDLSVKKKSPRPDKTVTAIISRINKLEVRIAALEKKGGTKTGKKRKRKLS